MEEVTLETVEQMVDRLSVEEQKQLVTHLETQWQKTAVLPRRPGSAVGKFFILAEDDEHLADFKVSSV